MQRTIHLDADSYRVSDGIVEFFQATEKQDDPYAMWPEYEYAWVRTAYEMGRQAVLVSATNVSPNAIRDGNNVPHHYLSFDLDGVPGNTNHSIKRTEGWRGTSNDRCVDAHGIVTIRKIRTLKNGTVAVTVS